MVSNEQGALIFPTEQQHRDNKAPGISYEDDYEGNALAAMIAPGQLEIRYQESFSDQRIACIVGQLATASELGFLRDCEIRYQGRPIRRLGG